MRLSGLSNEVGQFLDLLLVARSDGLVGVGETLLEDPFEDVLRGQLIDSVEKILVVEQEVLDRLAHARELRVETRAE